MQSRISSCLIRPYIVHALNSKGMIAFYVSSCVGIMMCRCLANFSLRNYGSNARKYARGNTRWESVLIAHCPSHYFMLHCIVVFISIFWMNIHVQNLAHLAKHRNRDYLSVCVLDGTSWNWFRLQLASGQSAPL